MEPSLAQNSNPREGLSLNKHLSHPWVHKGLVGASLPGTANLCGHNPFSPSLLRSRRSLMFPWSPDVPVVLREHPIPQGWSGYVGSVTFESSGLSQDHVFRATQFSLRL